MAFKRRFTLGAYLSGGAVNGDAWRDPSADIDADLVFERYRDYVALLEKGRFDAIFLFDTVGTLPDPATFERDPGIPRWDTFMLLAALAVTSRHIGLIGTANTTYNEPYNLARRVASLDRLSKGRAGWNVVTGTGGGENFGHDAHVAHADRYVRAEEFVDVVTGLWDSVSPDAYPRDRETGQWLDPSGLRPLNHSGPHFRVAGPLNTPPTVQRRPVLAQAGASGPGVALAARIGEVIYTAAWDVDAARDYRSLLLEKAAGFGRGPEHLRILPGLAPFIRPTEADARAAFEAYLGHLDQAETLRALSRYASLGIDLSVWPENKPIVIGEVAGTNSHKSRQSLIVDWIRRQKPYVRDVLRTFTRGGHRIIVGTPRSVADDMEGWFRSGAADGFNIMFTSAPDGIRDVVSLLCPELQRRGLLPEGYEGGSLRETLGLA
ncbi:NtaA/DmoA family FMN-dependent monooxygenase [Asaia astilbis]